MVKPEGLILICILVLVSYIVGYNSNIGTDNESKIEKNNSFPMKEDSKRIDGVRDITVYKTLDNKIRVAVIQNTQPADLGAWGLSNEIKRIITSPVESEWTKPLETFTIGDHLAASTRIQEVTSESRMRTNNIPDIYATAISYPGMNTILLITSNGDNLNWTFHNEMVERYRFK